MQVFYITQCNIILSIGALLIVYFSHVFALHSQSHLYVSLILCGNYVRLSHKGFMAHVNKNSVLCVEQLSSLTYEWNRENDRLSREAMG